MKHLVISISILVASITSPITSTASPAQGEYPPVPHFSLPSTQGQISSQIQPGDLKGKVIYIDFWASWCRPCKKSFPWLNEMHNRYQQQGLEILAINLDRDKSKAEKFLKQMPAKFRVAFDPQASTADKFKLKGMPTSFLIDRQGRMRHRHTGFRQRQVAEREQTIVQLLSE